MGLSPRSEAEPYGDEASGGGSGLSGATGGLGVFYAEEGREAAESRWLCQMLGEYRSVLGMIMSQCWGQRGLRHFSARRVPRGCCRRTPSLGTPRPPTPPPSQICSFHPAWPGHGPSPPVALEVRPEGAGALGQEPAADGPGSDPMGPTELSVGGRPSGRLPSHLQGG